MKTLAKYAILVTILFSSQFASCKHHHHHHHQHRIRDESMSIQLENVEQQELNLYKIQHLESQLSKTQNKLNMGTKESIIKAKKQAQDMTSSILDMVDDFTTQAKTNTKTQNKQNLKDLIRMKKEMEKSFKILSEGRAAGIKEVQKDVLGVTDDESDKLMDGIVTNETPEEPTPEDPIETPDTAVPTKDIIAKAIKKQKLKARIEKIAPAEQPEEGEVPQEPAPALEGDDPIEAAAESAVEQVEKPKKEKKTVLKVIIPLLKVVPPSSDDAPEATDADSAEDASDKEDDEASKAAESGAKKAAAALQKKINEIKKKEKLAKAKKQKQKKSKEIREQEAEVAKLDKELKRLEALAKKNENAITNKQKEAANKAKAKKKAKLAGEIAAKVAKAAKEKADKAKKIAKEKADKALKLKNQKELADARVKAQQAKIKAKQAKIKAKADAAAAAAAELEAARQRVIAKEKARQAKIDKQEMEDITRLQGMPNQSYEEFSKGTLEGSTADYDNSNDDFLKFLKQGDSDFDTSSTSMPEFDYATSLTSKDVPKHEGMFGSDKMETYDQIQKQMQIIQDILPKIKDAGKRAGLVKHFAPKMEQAMNALDMKINTEKAETKIKTPVKKMAQKKLKVIKKQPKKTHKKEITKQDFSEIEKLAEKLSEEKYQKKLKDDTEKVRVHQKGSKSKNKQTASSESADLSNFDYKDEKTADESPITSISSQPQSVIQVTNKEDKEKLQKQEQQIKDLEAKINSMTNEKVAIDKTKKETASGDLILPKLEALASKIENLEKIEKDRNTKDTSDKTVQMDFDKNKIVEVTKLAESMQQMIQQAQKQRKELNNSPKESPAPMPLKAEITRLKEEIKPSSDIKNRSETQGEINLTKAKASLKGSLDKPSTRGTISLLKKLI